MPLEDWMRKGVHELRRGGVTIVPVADSAMQPVQDLYEDLMSTRDSLADLSDGNYFAGADSAVQIDVSTVNGCVGAANYIKYAHISSAEHSLELCKPFIADLQPLMSEVCGELVVPVASQFILGDQHLYTKWHADFFNRFAITLLTPIYDYAPEYCSFQYWKLNTGDGIANWLGAALRSKRMCYCHLPGTHQTYAYRKREGVLFRGDVTHRTAPFAAPDGGWGTAKCRAIFAVVAVAPQGLQHSLNCSISTQLIQGSSGHHATIPKSSGSDNAVVPQLEDASHVEEKDQETKSLFRICIWKRGVTAD